MNAAAQADVGVMLSGQFQGMGRIKFRRITIRGTQQKSNLLSDLKLSPVHLHRLQYIPIELMQRRVIPQHLFDRKTIKFRRSGRWNVSPQSRLFRISHQGENRVSDRVNGRLMARIQQQN